MKAEEGKFKKKFAEYLEMLGCHVHITHGNQFQSGMPDMHITTPLGRFIFIEAKFWSNVHPPKDAHAIQKQLDGAQVNVIKHQHWKRNAPSFITSVIGNNLDNCAFCYKDEMCIINWKLLAKHIQQYNTLDGFLTIVTQTLRP